MGRAFIVRIALALYDQQGSICPGKGAYVIEPIGKWSVSQRNTSFLVATRLFRIGRPEYEQDSLSLKEEGVGTVIDILAAEVPKIQAHLFREILQFHDRLPKLDSVGGWEAGIVFQATQSTAKLRFTYPAVAEKQDLDLGVEPLADLKILVVGADFIQDVLEVFLAVDFRGQIVQLAAKQAEFP